VQDIKFLKFSNANLLKRKQLVNFQNDKFWSGHLKRDVRPLSFPDVLSAHRFRVGSTPTPLAVALARA